MDVFAQDFPAKRSREPSPADMTDEGSYKRQRTTKVNEPMGINTPQDGSPAQESWVTTPSTGSSGAIMTPSDDIEPTPSFVPERLPSSAPSRSSSASLRTKYPIRSAVRTQGSDTPADPSLSRDQSRGSIPASVPINLGPETQAPSMEVHSGGPGARTRARRARIARAGRDEQAVAEEDDGEDEVDDDDEVAE